MFWAIFDADMLTAKRIKNVAPRAILVAAVTLAYYVVWKQITQALFVYEDFV